MAAPQPLPKHPRLLSDDQLGAWVEGLVDAKVSEGLLLDYKRRPYRLSMADQKIELAKDVTSFANSQGGAILLGVPDPTNKASKEYGVKEVTGYDRRLRDVLDALVLPGLPALEVRWVPKRNTTDTGVYLIWHPESWDAPHMVHGPGEFRYYRRAGERSVPVPMTAAEVERLYERRLRGQQRAEAFLGETDFALRRMPDNSAALTICLCPRLLFDRAINFSDESFQAWLRDNPFRLLGSPLERWEPHSSGAYTDLIAPQAAMWTVARIYGNAALSVVWRLGNAVVRASDELELDFVQISQIAYDAYTYAGRLYDRLGWHSAELRVRTVLHGIGSSWLRGRWPNPRKVVGGTHKVDDTVIVAEIMSDVLAALRPMLDAIWRTFQQGWRVPDDHHVWRSLN